jgi:8-oxo-dGTP pyrophosphatase MutT (NUDIX family)
MVNEQKFHLGIKALITNNKNEILVLKTNPEALKSNKPVHWDLPGGCVLKNQSIEQTLRREIKEELYIDEIEILEHFGFFVSNLKIPVNGDEIGLILSVYLCKINENSPIKLSFEHTECKWVSIKESKELLKIKYPKSFIEKLDNLSNNKRFKNTNV